MVKTPKPSTPGIKPKLSTPRSGFIMKNKDSAKKNKFNVFGIDSAKKSNGTPMIDKSAFMEKKLVGGKKSKSPIISNDSPGTNKDREKKSPSLKRNVKAEFHVEGISIEEKPIKKDETPKSNKFQSFNSKLKQNKTSPEVQLGLDIEQFLDNNSSIKKDKNECPKATPIGAKEVQVKKKGSPGDNQPKKSEVKSKGKKAPSTPKTLVKSRTPDELVGKITLTSAVKALIKYVDGNPKEKNEIFGPNIPFLLQINFIKAPQIKFKRVLVPHTLLSENSDVCLLISDKGKKQDSEDLVDEMKERLKRCGVKCITEVLPWKKALFEHSQYEQKRKLMDRYDFFLIERKLTLIKSGLTKGVPFKKWPVPVILEPESKLKTNIETALRKIPMSFKGVGLTRSLKFGHYKMSVEQLVENLQAILRDFCDETRTPNGCLNIRSLFIKTERSSSFPLYVTTKSSNRIKETLISNNEKEKDEGVEGELSTFLDRNVVVFKDGTVSTKKIKKAEENKRKQLEKKKMTVKEEDSEESSEDIEEGSAEMTKEEVEEESEGGEEEESDDEEEEESDDEDEEESDDEENEEMGSDDELDDEEMSYEEGELTDKITGIKKSNMKRKIKESSKDYKQIEQAERNFLMELKKSQQEIESKGITKINQDKSGKAKNKKYMKIPPKKEQNASVTSPGGKDKSGKQLSQGNKQSQQPNVHSLRSAAVVNNMYESSAASSLQKGRKNFHTYGLIDPPEILNRIPFTLANITEKQLNRNQEGKFPSKNANKRKWKNNRGNMANSPQNKQVPNQTNKGGKKFKAKG